MNINLYKKHGFIEFSASPALAESVEMNTNKSDDADDVLEVVKCLQMMQETETVL